ncbi:hypothetical protein BDA99DRAFT_228383 [Phascolomyces articulosus]|uniref:Carrier domain-containing protein n=1 Tax=Phascolomyces articulosus TaxID=60185 RepID=A0AAD5JQ03_9FUNG|nr:hypothetical protein BDA99DRAFT_228383 [Phascolomyces articulosus]
MIQSKSEPYHYMDCISYAHIVELQASRHKERVFTRYQMGNSSEFKTLTYGQMGQLTEYLANKWDKILDDNVRCVAFLSDHPVHTMLATFAFFKLGIAFFPLSTRNSKTAIVHLLKETDTDYLIASQKYGAIAQECVNELSEQEGKKGNRGLEIWDDLNMDKLIATAITEAENTWYRRQHQPFIDPEKTALIFHSSGTTSLPKPIRLSTRYNAFLNMEAILNHIQQCAPSLALNSTDTMMILAPLFHIYGASWMLVTMLVGASTLVFHHLPPSPQDVLSITKKYNVTAMITVPMVLEQLADFLQTKQQQIYKNMDDYVYKTTEEEVTILKQIKFCITGGAPLPYNTGYFLHSKGLNVRNIIASTETGIISLSNPSDEATKWDYIKPSENVQTYFLFEPFDKNIYRLVIKSTSPSLASGIGNRPNGDYETNDLFSESPPGSDYWRLVGRVDDTLIMKNGEKTNATSMEQIISTERLVQACTVVGANKECTAVLIELDVDRALQYSPTQMISKVYDAVEQANTHAPRHSTIMVPQMVYILPLNQQLPITPKGTVRRNLALVQFKDEIQQLYDAFLHNTTKELAVTDTPSDSDSLASLDDSAFLIHITAQVLQRPQADIDVNVSLFDYGLDSLRAIQLRNRIATRFQSISSNFLFENPTLHSMKIALFLTSVNVDSHHVEVNTQQQQQEKRYSQTQSILQEYLKRAASDFPKIMDQNLSTKEITILLTGSTGALGAFLLRDMIESSKVKKIYCIVRGEQDILMKRIQASFEERGIDTSLLSKDKVEAIPMNLNDPKLGLGAEMYNKLKEEVTMIQCCGWLLDFHQPVDHFERECIRGLYNLLQFSYRETNPMCVHVVSSVSTMANYYDMTGADPSAEKIPECYPPENPRVALPMGYAQSKYIVEHIFAYLAKEKNLPYYIERLGQVCGDSQHGRWNTSEQYPLLFAGGSAMGIMPDFTVNVDWIPVDYAATSIFEIMLKTTEKEDRCQLDNEENKNHVYHIVNPNTTSWTDIMKAIKICGIEFSLVKPRTWTDELKKHEENPGYRLLPFFENPSWETMHTQCMTQWDTSHATQMTSSLAQAPVFDAQLLKKCFSAWQESGFL